MSISPQISTLINIICFKLKALFKHIVIFYNLYQIYVKSLVYYLVNIQYDVYSCLLLYII